MLTRLLVVSFAVSLTFGTLAAAQYCPSSAPQCANDSTNYHQLVLRKLGGTFWNPTTFDAYLGSVDYFGTEYLAACIEQGGTQTIAFLYDNTDGAYISTLDTHSFFCGSSGNDEIRIMRDSGAGVQSFKICGPVVSSGCISDASCGSGGVCISNNCYNSADIIFDISTSGWDFDIYGGLGDDALYGEGLLTGPLESNLLCGGSGRDFLYDTRFADGWTGNDVIQNIFTNGKGYGYSGCDVLSCGNSSSGDDCYGEAGSDCVQEISTNSPPSNSTISCGTDSAPDYTPHDSGTSSCENQWLNVSVLGSCLTWTPSSGRGDSC